MPCQASSVKRSRSRSSSASASSVLGSVLGGVVGAAWRLRLVVCSSYEIATRPTGTCGVATELSKQRGAACVAE